MAVEIRTAGQSFVSGIVGAVSDLQRQTMQMVGDFSSERGAARMAWRGTAPKPAAPPPPPPPPAVAEPAARPKAQAKAHPKPQTKAPEPAEKPAVSDLPPPRDMGEDLPPH